MEMHDPPSKDPKESDPEEWLFISLKWMKPGAVAAVPLYAEALRLPRAVTLAQLRDAILEQTTNESTAEFHNLVAQQKFQMHFVYKGTILKEEENDTDSPSLRDLCPNVASNAQITLFVVLSNPPPPPKAPEVRPPVRSTVSAAASATTPTAAPPPPPRPEPPQPTERLPLPDAMMDNLQQQFPEHDIRGLVSTLFSHPDARAQMERSFDLQLAQLDHVPGGMSLLQSLYTQQQDQEERMLWHEPTRNAANAGSDDAAAIAGATGQAMPNPWHNRRRRPPPQRTLPTASPAVRPTLPPIALPPNPWASASDETEQLYDHSTAHAVTTESPATIPADNPWRVDPAQEQLLFDMGFTNRARNRTLLQQHDWETAVELLLREAADENDAAE